MVELTLFQNIINGSIPCHKVAEGTHWFAFLDIAPRRAGHTLVVPKKGVQRLSDLDETEAAALIIPPPSFGSLPTMYNLRSPGT